MVYTLLLIFPSLNYVDETSLLNLHTNQYINLHSPYSLKHIRNAFRGTEGNRTPAIGVLQTPAFPLRHCANTTTQLYHVQEDSLNKLKL